MEQLTKQQIVLVTLLVSFVTSIATGIVTVALMDQAPPGVTQTINRVVERTIEKVTPAPTQQQAAVVTKETVVVKEDDLVVAAVDKNTKSLVSIFATHGSGDGSSTRFVGNGLIITKDGLIATDAVANAPQDDSGNSIPETFKATLADDTSIALASVATADGSGSSLAFFKPKIDDLSAQSDKTDKTKVPTFTPASLADASALKLGQTVIAIGGEKISVATGIVSNLADMSGSPVSSDTATTTGASKKSTLRLITTDIHTGGKTPGSILVNLSGDVVGIRAAAGESGNLFLPAGFVSAQLTKLSSLAPLK